MRNCSCELSGFFTLYFIQLSFVLYFKTVTLRTFLTFMEPDLHLQNILHCILRHNLSWPIVLHVICGLLWLLHLLPPLFLAARVRPWTLIGTADWLKVLGSREVGLAVGHRHAGICWAVLMEGVRICWGRQGKWAIAPSLTWRIQDVLIAAWNFAAELDTTRHDCWKLVSKDSSWQALCAAQSAWMHRGLAAEGGAEGRAHWGAVLGAVGRDWGDLWDLP